ncbi:uncharacterized protein LOC119738184 isoform X2 [Patiria miniata]|uniref:EGF-like domain-containing protein n=1 Tax=Patiria miniata TaxID=46514 RepID=A0A914AXJ7_PATMI|nr:uncharacterized protein LOC119738184 isoform X2 [Patiria miniata]
MMSLSCIGRTPSILNAFLFLLLLYPQSSATEVCGNSTLTDCKNDGVCLGDGTCECPGGYAGPKCETAVVSVAILVLVCIMPMITWTIICGYGWRSYRARVRRRRRRRARAGSAPDAEANAPVDDDPPGYYQAVYENPVVTGLGENPDWTTPPSNYLELPPHYEDLINAIKSTEDMPTPVIIQMEPAEAGECSRPVGDLETLTGEPRRLRGGPQTQSDQNEDSEVPDELPSQIGATRGLNCDCEIGRDDSSNSCMDQGTPDDEPSSFGTHSRPASEEGAPPNQRETEDDPSLEIPSETASGTRAKISLSKKEQNQRGSEDKTYEDVSNKRASEDISSSKGSDVPKEGSNSWGSEGVFSRMDSNEESTPECSEDFINPEGSEELPANQRVSEDALYKKEQSSQ